MSGEEQSSVVHTVDAMNEFIMLSGKDSAPSRRYVFHRRSDGWIQEEQIEQDGQWKTIGSIELDHIQFAGPIDD